jgi:hypothetical protein
MTKIVVKAASGTAGLFAKALIVLPKAAVIAFHSDESMLYVTDDYATAALSYLRQANISAEIVRS